jgi:hypothetical protein
MDCLVVIPARDWWYCFQLGGHKRSNLAYEVSIPARDYRKHECLWLLPSIVNDTG